MQKQAYIQRIQSELKQGTKYNKRSIESLAKGYGISNKNLVKEYTELAIVLNARAIAHNNKLSTYEKYLGIVELYHNQVNLSMRTSMSVMMQQYSTPAPISFLASSYVLKEQSLSGYKAFKNIVKGSTKGKIKGNAHLTNPYNNNKPRYFEPSAGNGLLTIALPYAQTYVNELDDVRLENLKEQPFAKVSNQDATQLFVDYLGKFDGIVTNPPFGSLGETLLFDNFKIKRLEHAMCINALKCMKDTGKASLIIGGHTSWEDSGRITGGHNRIFLNYLYHFYHVEDVIPINGKKLYSRQGTAFNTRLILINGRKEKPEGAAPLKSKLQSTIINSHDELWKRVGLEQKQSVTKKEYWEKTAEELIQETIMNLSIFKEPSSAKWFVDNMDVEVQDSKTEKIYTHFKGYKITPSLLKKYGKQAHYNLVKKAISKGKTIPTNVLQNYPDLLDGKQSKKNNLVKKLQFRAKAIRIKQEQLQNLGLIQARKNEYWTSVKGDIVLVRLLDNGMIEWDDFVKGKVRGIRAKSELFKRKSDAKKYFKTI